MYDVFVRMYVEIVLFIRDWTRYPFHVIYIDYIRHIIERFAKILTGVQRHISNLYCDDLCLQM